MKLFRKYMLPRCTYCAHSKSLSEDDVICKRRGVVPAAFACRRFVYNPLKRIPAPPPQLAAGYTAEDFSLT